MSKETTRTKPLRGPVRRGGAASSEKAKDLRVQSRN